MIANLPGQLRKLQLKRPGVYFIDLEFLIDFKTQEDRMTAYLTSNEKEAE